MVHPSKWNLIGLTQQPRTPLHRRYSAVLCWMRGQPDLLTHWRGELISMIVYIRVHGVWWAGSADAAGNRNFPAQSEAAKICIPRQLAASPVIGNSCEVAYSAKKNPPIPPALHFVTGSQSTSPPTSTQTHRPPCPFLYSSSFDLSHICPHTACDSRNFHLSPFPPCVHQLSRTK